jgi:transcription elongation factor GreA
MDDRQFLPPDRPERKPGQEPTARLTLDAYIRMRKELEHLRTEGRQRIAERLLHAREFGDIRENAEYDAAKNEQALMEARIRELEYKLKDPDIIEVGDSDEVGPGTLVTVRLRDQDRAGGEDDEETYLVALSSEERAPGVRTVTAASPLGSALLGRRVGDRVTYQAPGGEFTYEVVSLRPYRPD